MNRTKEATVGDIIDVGSRAVRALGSALSRPETNDDAVRRWAKTMALAGGLTGAAALPPFIMNALTSPLTIDAEPTDLDVDLIHPAQVRRALEERKRREEQKLLPAEKEASMEKGARVPASTHWPMMAAALVGGGLLGYEASERIADAIGEARRKRALQKARKEFRQALLEEQVAALEAGGESPYAAAMQKGAQDEGSLGQAAEDLRRWAAEVAWPWLGRKLQTAGDYGLGAYGMYALPAGIGTYLLARPYIDRKDPNRKKFRRARKELLRRLEQEPPYAQLAEIDPKLLEKVIRSRK